MNQSEYNRINEGNVLISGIMRDIHSMEGKLRNKMETSIFDMVTAMGGRIEVDFDNDDIPIVTYDGGRHPEYNATPCAQVQLIEPLEKNGFKRFRVDMDVCEEYESDRFDIESVEVIFDYVYWKFDDYCEQLGLAVENIKEFT